jgi:quercetin dioxygenase-like cupin family protein
MTMVESQPRPNWSAFTLHKSKGVDFRVLLDRDGLAIGNLRFSEDAAIGEHSAPFDIDVLCIAGEGFVSIGSQSSPLLAGQRVFWPAGQRHRLWTTGSKMETLMIERHSKRLDK